MNRILFSALFLLQFTVSWSQPLPYRFIYREESYQPLQNAQLVDLSNYLPLPQTFYAKVPLGFSFQIDSIYVDSVFVSVHRPVIAWPTPSEIEPGASGGSDVFLFKCRKSSDTLASTEIRYSTTGLPPNRIFKIEYHQLGFLNLPGYINVQAWLYEKSDSIQIRIGELNLPDTPFLFKNGMGPEIGFVLAYIVYSFDNDEADYAHFAKGNPFNPSDTSFTLVDTPFGFEGFFYGLDGVPKKGAVFTFYPQKTTSIHPIVTDNEIYISPNPAHEIVTLQGFECGLDDAKLLIFNQLGQLMLQEVLPAGTNSFSCSNFVTGHYWVEVLTKNKRFLGNFEKSD